MKHYHITVRDEPRYELGMSVSAENEEEARAQALSTSKRTVRAHGKLKGSKVLTIVRLEEVKESAGNA
jgi:hypothetical protein